MSTHDYTISFAVSKTPDEIFHAINDVAGWWTENVQGTSQLPDDEFEVRFGDVHYSNQKLITVVPGEKIVWEVTDSYLNFLQDKNEWTGTKISFEISEEDGQSRVQFTHLGLLPTIECFDACSNAWANYIQGSLQQYITTGEGRPDKKKTIV